MTIPYHVGPDCPPSGRPFLNLVLRRTWSDVQCCTGGPGYECGCPEACACKCPECACKEPLAWHYGPTATDPDPGKMWCPCGGEVYAIKDAYICSRCERQAE